MANGPPAPVDPDKLRGGYYTPDRLAGYLGRWAVRAPSDRILEPSCGDGAVTHKVSDLLGREGHLTAVEIVPAEIAKARERSNGACKQTDWINGCFFSAYTALLSKERFDAVVGNPPFIRFQTFTGPQKGMALAQLQRFGYRANGLTNAWVAFVELSAELLADGGRLAMVVPAELLQVQYAAELRYRLPALFEDILIVAFRSNVFKEVQQEVVLLLADGRNRDNNTVGSLHTAQVENLDELLRKEQQLTSVQHLPVRHIHEDMKWTGLFLGERQFELLDQAAQAPEFRRLGDLAGVDVGVTTGNNKFFVISEAKASELRIGRHATKLVGRTAALKSILFTEADFAAYSQEADCRMIDLRGVPVTGFSPELKQYLAEGEREGVHLGYKCQIRHRWYDVPFGYIPEAFLSRNVHRYPMMSANKARATSTDTIHRVSAYPGTNTERLCASLINVVSMTWYELAGRSYGGGLLEIVPSEAGKVPVPYQAADRDDPLRIDQACRSQGVEAAIEKGNDLFLRRTLGWSSGDVKELMAAHRLLMERRHKRTRKSVTKEIKDK